MSTEKEKLLVRVLASRVADRSRAASEIQKKIKELEYDLRGLEREWSALKTECDGIIDLLADVGVPEDEIVISRRALDHGWDLNGVGLIFAFDDPDWRAKYSDEEVSAHEDEEQETNKNDGV